MRAKQRFEIVSGLKTTISRSMWLLAILGLLTAACQSATPAAQETSAPDITGEETTSPQPSEKPDDESLPPPVDAIDQDQHPVITFTSGEWERSLYEPLIEQFNQEHAEMTVQFVPMPEPTGEGDEELFQDYYRLQASSGDTSILWGTAMVPSNYFLDIQSLIESDPTADIDDFWPGILEGCQDLEGRQLGVPVFANLNGIYYDRTAFNEAGLPDPAMGWTWDDFRDAITTIANNTGTRTRYGLAELYTTILYPIVEKAVDENDGEIDAETLLSYVGWYIDLVNAKAILPPAVYFEEGSEDDWNKQWEAWQNAFKSENRPGIWPGSITEVMPGVDYMGPSEDDPLEGLAIQVDGFAPYPVDLENPNDHSTPISVQCMAISSGSRNPRAAWTWLNFLSRQRLVRDSYGPWESMQLPARISVADNAGYWDDLPAGLQNTITYIIDHAWYGSTYPDITYQIVQAVVKTAMGKSDLATALLDVPNQGDGETIPSPTPNLTPVVVATPRPTLSADSTVIEFFYQAWGTDRVRVTDLIDKYNQANPGTAVILRSDFAPSGDEDYLTALTDEFDCFVWYASGRDTPKYFLGLDPMVQAEGPVFIQDFDPGLLDVFSVDDTLYGLPASSQPQILAYNADLLSEKDIELPGFDWTFDDFIDLATQASGGQGEQATFGLMTNLWDNFLLDGSSAQWIDLSADPPVATFDSSEFINALAWLDSLNKDGVLLVDNGDNWAETQSAMQDGRIAFWMTMVGQPLSWYYDGESAPYEVGVLPMPILENSPTPGGYWSNDQAYFISAQSQNAQACWDWIKYLSEQPNVIPGIPARRSVQNSPDWEATVGSETADAYRQALANVKRSDPQDLQAWNNPIIWPYYQWRQEIMTALFEGEDYQKVATIMQQRADDYLVCMSTVDTENLTDVKIQEETNRCALQVDPEGPWAP